MVVDNAARLNCLSGDLVAALGDALDRVAADPAARVVVLEGAGERAWIGGADINELAGLDADSAVRFIRRLAETCEKLRRLPVPVVARIDGYCLGAGLEIAACCDLRLAGPAARFAMPEVQVGIPSVIHAAVLPRLIGIGRARDLVLTGRMIDAATAMAWGLLDGLAADPAALDGLLETRLGEILSAAPGAVRAQKVLCRQWEELPLTDAVEAGVSALGAAYRTAEPAEYTRRFLARRR